MKVLRLGLFGVLCLLIACNSSNNEGRFDNEKGVVATIDDVSITIKDIEMLYDMQAVSNSLTNTSLSDLHTDYAQLVFLSIQQVLVQNALEEYEIEVSHETATAVENLIRAEYDLKGEGIFENYLIQNGIDIECWRGQLRFRLEMEALQKILLRNETISVEEVSAYFEANPEVEKIPARITFAILSSSSKAKLASVRRSQDISRENLEKQEISIQPVLLDVEIIPEEWAGILNLLSPDEFSPIRTVKVKDADGYDDEEERTIYQSFYLIESTPELTINSVETYAIIERILISQKLPLVMEEWFAKELEHYDIKVLPQFLPENIPRYEGIQPLVLDSPV